MIKILQHVHQYVPTVEQEEKIFIPSQEQYVLKSNTVQHQILFGGDQLTVARVRGAQIAMSNSNNSVKKLQGLIPVIQDWHTEVILTEVCMFVPIMYTCIYIFAYLCAGNLEILLQHQLSIRAWYIIPASKQN